MWNAVLSSASLTVLPGTLLSSSALLSNPSLPSHSLPKNPTSLAAGHACIKCTLTQKEPLPPQLEQVSLKAHMDTYMKKQCICSTESLFIWSRANLGGEHELELPCCAQQSFPLGSGTFLFTSDLNLLTDMNAKLLPVHMCFSFIFLL